MNILKLIQSGLYKITCVSNQKIYIGQAVNILHRLERHAEKLENGEHESIALLEDYKRYGYKQFSFEALFIAEEWISQEARITKEKQLVENYFDKYPNNFQDFIYNVSYEQPLSRKHCIIGHVMYPSIREAERLTGIPKTTLLRKFASVDEPNCLILETTQVTNRAKPILVKGIFITSVQEAVKANLIGSESTAYRRLKDANNTDWVYAELNDYVVLKNENIEI